MFFISHKQVIHYAGTFRCTLQDASLCKCQTSLLLLKVQTNHLSYYKLSNVCLFVCSPTPPRFFDGSLPNLVGVCRWTSELPLRGSFLKRSMGQRVNRSTSLFRSRRHQAETTPLQKAYPAKGTRRLRV